MRIEVNVKIKEILSYRLNLSVLSLFLIFVVTTGIFVAYPQIQNRYECIEVERLYDESLSNLIETDSKARSEWKSFPKYTAVDEWSKWQEEEGWKDPAPPGEPIYRSFQHYWKENYEFEFDREFRISSRLVVNNPNCFDPRTVTEEQERLAN